MATQPQQPQINISPNLIKFVIFGLLLLFLFSILSSTVFITINSGEKAVIFRRLAGGIDKEKVLGQGLNIVAPWDKVDIYSTRLQENLETMSVLSKNGLNIGVEMTYRYQPIEAKLPLLHDEIGREFHQRIIMPEIRSATREVIGKYLPEELYSTKREAIQDEIYNQTRLACLPKYINIDAVLIRGVKLPATLEAAIERKLKEEQASLEYDYRLEKERKEAQRRIIEAEAKAESNRLLSASLTDKILKDKGIEATLELAKSPNSKVVIVGGADGGLPLILNN